MARYERNYTGERFIYDLHLKLMPSQGAELEAGAALHDVRMSDYVRGLLMSRSGAAFAATSRRRNPEAAALMKALDAAAHESRAVGNLLNQLLKHLHTVGGDPRVMDEVREALARQKQTEELYAAALERVLDSVGM